MMRAGLIFLGLFVASHYAWPAEVRFYTINSKQQQRLVGFVMGTSKPGCHGFLAKRRIHRVAQVGFAYCRLFNERDCKPEDIVKVRWKNKEPPTDKLTPGARWFLEGEQGSKIASWECVTQP